MDGDEPQQARLLHRKKFNRSTDTLRVLRRVLSGCPHARSKEPSTFPFSSPEERRPPPVQIMSSYPRSAKPARQRAGTLPDVGPTVIAANVPLEFSHPVFGQVLEISRTALTDHDGHVAYKPSGGEAKSRM